MIITGRNNSGLSVRPLAEPLLQGNPPTVRIITIPQLRLYEKNKISVDADLYNIERLGYTRFIQ